MTVWNHGHEADSMSPCLKCRSLARRAEEEAADAALLDALNTMGSRGMSRRLVFNTNDRDAVMASLLDAGFTVVRDQ